MEKVKEIALEFAEALKGVFAKNSEYCVMNSSVDMSLVRNEQLDGEEYLVCPCVMIKVGVWNGLNYSFEDLEDSVETWNNKPVSLNTHPERGGWDKAKLEKYRGGFLLNTRMDGDRLLSDLWINKKKAERLSPGLTEKMNDGTMFEVSTGLFCHVRNDNDAVNIKGDHLAVLVGEEGACSVADGAGAPRLNRKESAVATESDKGIDNINQENKMKDAKPVADSPEKVVPVESEEVAPVVEPEVEPKEDVQKEDVVEPVVEKEEPVVKEEAEGAKEEPQENSSKKGADPEVEKALAFYNSKKAELVEILVSNSKCEFSKEELEGRDVEELQKLDKMCAVVDYSGGASVENAAKVSKDVGLPDPWDK